MQGSNWIRNQESLGNVEYFIILVIKKYPMTLAASEATFIYLYAFYVRILV